MLASVMGDTSFLSGSNSLESICSVIARLLGLYRCTVEAAEPSSMVYGIWHSLFGYTADRDWHGAKPGNLLPVLGAVRSRSTGHGFVVRFIVKIHDSLAQLIRSRQLHFLRFQDAYCRKEEGVTVPGKSVFFGWPFAPCGEIKGVPFFHCCLCCSPK